MNVIERDVVLIGLAGLATAALVGLAAGILIDHAIRRLR